MDINNLEDYVSMSHLLLSKGYTVASYDFVAGTLIYSSKTSTTAFYCELSDVDILVFKGTKEKLDWKTNLRFWPFWYGTGWCHKGFARAHQSVWDEIKPLINYQKPLLVTGHSLGGALAEKSVDFLRGHEDLHLITFGKPNVHLRNHIPKSLHLKTQLSVVNGSDVVTKVPRFFYSHDKNQNMLYLANNGNDYINPDKEFRRNDRNIIQFVSDHSMKGYSERINKILIDNQPEDIHE